MRGLKIWVFGCLLGVSFAANAATYNGGEIPIPFETANQKVELADGEYYILVGKVSWDDQGYFEPDFTEHPWLASEYRMKAPKYPTFSAEGMATATREEFESLSDQRVKVMVRAKSTSGAISLELFEKPEIHK